MLYKIYFHHIADDTIFLPDTTAAFLGIEQNQTITVSFGKRKLPAVVKTVPFNNEYRIGVSENAKKELLIDPDVNYEVMYANNELIIGPVIGLLLAKSEERLAKYLHHYLIYTMLYEQINGILFVFCEQQIDFTEEKITGYVYDPASPTSWRKAVLPFPGAVFRRVELGRKTLKGLQERIGPGFFNAQYFDKWQFWNWLSPFEELREHLAETTNKVNVNNLNIFLEKYNGVYLKSRNGSRGQGIYYIEKQGNQYIILENYKNDIRTLSSEQMAKFLRRHSFFLLQQPIRLHAFEERMVDYRVILQKDRTGQWQCTGMIARFGKSNAITSNFKASGYAMEGRQALMTQFGYDELTAFKKYQEIISICTKMACKADEIAGAYADFGIDVGIDEDYKVWVIEMNKRPDHDFPLMIKDRKMYYSVKSNPVLYAKYIAMGGK
ncbi:YheC/YheD family endospore coat-associated protein [Neobacillus kokaensis]|uniref:ATP-grasp domain-containing protein n=1 Tax=Neobacillus kokaensis TaxID=2759023 RepID=A0ABQ3N7T0_9BACI|nr:YheC/YheD family protein [Neobacillus kokaensis]GHH99573.1 hypothetical protein AM1BK_31160 [Neobacillus kokaensis]